MIIFDRIPSFLHASFVVIAVGIAASLSACSHVVESSGAEDRAAVDIGDLSQGGVAVTSLKTPPGYKQGDKLVTYEGPGWESDRVAYRLYLDGRNAIDIFGKRKPDLVLADVGRGGDYHTMADWGMDILKVGNSLGAGGFGVLRGDKATQIGDAASYKAEVIKDTDKRAHLRVTHEDSVVCGDDIVANYVITGGSRLTEVTISGACESPFVAGLVIHPDTEAISREIGAWGVIAQRGRQTLPDDNLGMALFYRTADVIRAERDEDDHFIVFADTISPHYYFGAAWEQEPENVASPEAFSSWLDSTLNSLNGNDQ